MSNFTIQLNGPISVFDINGNLVLSQTLTGIKTPVSNYSQGRLAISAAAAALPLPASQTNFVYLQNIGTATAVVSWVPNGGSGAIVQNLGVSSTTGVMQVGTTAATGASAITVSCAAATVVS